MIPDVEMQGSRVLNEGTEANDENLEIAFLQRLLPEDEPQGHEEDGFGEPFEQFMYYGSDSEGEILKDENLPKMGVDGEERGDVGKVERMRVVPLNCLKMICVTCIRLWRRRSWRDSWRWEL